jgi:hypothetical protein
VPGRIEPYQTYGGTSGKTFSIGFRFQAQGVYETTAESLLNEVVKPARFLDALKYPVYDTSYQIAYAPPPVIVRVGNLFVARCILTGGSPRWSGPFDPATMYPHRCDFDATFTVVHAVALTGASLVKTYETIGDVSEVEESGQFLELPAFA